MKWSKKKKDYELAKRKKEMDKPSEGTKQINDCAGNSEK